MRILHTADWHLGVKIPQLGIDRTKEQEKIIEKIKNFIEQKKVDIVIIAGDIFDIPLPTIEAERILLSFLSDVAGDMKRYVLMINGNHDSAEKIHTLNTLSNVFEGRIKSFVIVSRIDESNLTLEINGIHFLGIPFTPKYRYSGEYKDIFEKILSFYLPKIEDNVILFSHDIVSGSTYSGTELKYDDKVLSIGSISKINGFEKIIYWGLGHIHLYQEIVKNKIYYSGSIIQIDFGEKYQKKGVVFLELEDKNTNVEFVEIPQEYTLEQITIKSKEDIEKILENKDKFSSKFLKILVNEKVPHSLLKEIKNKMDNVILSLENSTNKFSPTPAIESIERVINNPVEAFKNYCKELNKDISEEEIIVLKEIYDKVMSKFNE